MALINRFRICGRAWSRVFPALLFCATLAPIAAAAAQQGAEGGNVTRGRELYWRGITATGAPIKGVTAAGIVLSGTQLSCVNCHRPSGFGSSEGGKYVPPITGPILFAPRELNRNRIFHKLFKEAQPGSFSARLREPRMRPAYTMESLAKAIRGGVDPAHQNFDPEMPRYEIDDSGMADLLAYLKTLSVSHDPGVAAETIHLATVVSDTADPAQRDAVLETISAFFDWMNTRVAGNRRRPDFSPYYHSGFQNSFQQWQLHVWQLHGPPETWTKQIQSEYQKAPVFAVVSGFVDGPWEPVAQFCDAEHLPCIFPNTELPKTRDARGGYSLYFSRGLELEADVLARFLADKVPRAGSIVQIHSGDPGGMTPAEEFVRAAHSLSPDVEIRSVSVSTAEELRDAIHSIATQTKLPDAVVLWPGKYQEAALQELAHLPPDVKIASLPVDAFESASPAALSGLPKSVIFTYPYELPTAYYPRVFRVRQWMHARSLEIRYPRLQFQTYYALTLLQFGLDQILDDFFRDYLVEAIEHEAESHLDNGTHPTLALGPGQRFASKGAYIVKPDSTAGGGLRPVSEWIVPDSQE